MKRVSPGSLEAVLGFLVGAALAVVVAVCVAGCGGGGRGSVSRGTGSVKRVVSSPSVTWRAPAFAAAELRQELIPGPAVVRVGGYVITKPELDKVVRPPGYKLCFKQHRENEVPADRHHTATELEALCRHLYVERQKLGMTTMIRARWVLGEAADLGITPSETEVKQILERESKKLPGGQAELQKYLKGGETMAELASRVAVGLATERIRAKYESGVPPVTPARIAAYYHNHLKRYTTPETRDIEAIRTWTERAITNAKTEVLAGKSFAGIARRVSIDRPSNEHGGIILGVVPGQAEEGLDQAIFKAPLNKLIGPLHLRQRYYIFKVLKIRPAHQQPLTTVKTEITKTLTEELKQQTLAQHIHAWRTKWHAKTTCQPGYINPKCRQYKPSKPLPGYTKEEDPYTLA